MQRLIKLKFESMVGTSVNVTACDMYFEELKLGEASKH